MPGLAFSSGSEINWEVTLGMGLDTRDIRNFIHGVTEGSLGDYHFGDGF